MFSFQIASCTHTKYKPSLRKEAVVSSIRYNNIIHSSPLKSLFIQWMEVGLIGKIMVNVHRTVYLKIGMLKVQLRQPSLLKEE